MWAFKSLCQEEINKKSKTNIEVNCQLSQLQASINYLHQDQEWGMTMMYSDENKPAQSMVSESAMV